MTEKGMANQVANDIRLGLKQIIRDEMMDRYGNVKGTQRFWGYVCAVNMEDGSDNYGTVNVQEYVRDASEGDGVGLHPDVLLSALQNNKTGMWVIPSLYSDVMISEDRETGLEYVIMCSHVDLIQMRSHKNVEISVVETEEFQEGDDGDDVQDLKETGTWSKSLYDKEHIEHHFHDKDENEAYSEYDKDHIVHHFNDKDDNDAYTEHNKDHIIHKINNSAGETTIEQRGDSVVVTARNSTVTIKTDGTIDVKGVQITVNGSSSLKTSSPNTTINGSLVQVTGTQFIRKGVCVPDGSGGFCGIPVCPFTGAPHIGTMIIGG